MGGGKPEKPYEYGINTEIMINSTSTIAITGAVTRTGIIGRGTGFTPTRVNSGHYRVSFTPALDLVPIVLVTTSADTAGWTFIATLSEVCKTSFDVTIQDRSGRLCDLDFCFAVLTQ